MVLVDCTCKPDEPYADGTLPRFHTEESKAIFDFMKHKKKRPLYWGVHLNGLHVCGKTR